MKNVLQEPFYITQIEQDHNARCGCYECCGRPPDNRWAPQEYVIGTCELCHFPVLRGEGTKWAHLTCFNTTWTEWVELSTEFRPVSEGQRIKNLRPYFQIARQEAKKSPCSRRQYGCVITWPTTMMGDYVTGYNARASNCCDGACARTKFNTGHGGRVEIGAEVHAETAALINWKGDFPASEAFVVLAGYMGDKELLGRDIYSCHTCALNLKYAGFDKVYVTDDDGTIIRVSVEDMIERREGEWVD